MSATTVLNVLGRVMLATIFFMSAAGNKIPNFGEVTKYMESAGVPAPSLMLVGGIVFLLAGSVSVVLGFKARIGAGLLLVFLVLATYYFHNFWAVDAGSEAFQMQMIQFMKNLGLAGAMVMLIANGSGAGSLDQVLGKPPETASH